MGVDRDAAIHGRVERQATRRAAGAQAAVLEARYGLPQSLERHGMMSVRLDGTDVVARVDAAEACRADAVIGTDIQEQTALVAGQMPKAEVALVMRQQKWEPRKHIPHHRPRIWVALDPTRRGVLDAVEHGPA